MSTSSISGGLLVAQVLAKHGVRFLFTLCGGHISPILVESKKIGIRVVDVRHEATAVFAADAVARLTGIPGVAVVTAGPGITNTITAVKNAQMAQSPLILLGGATATILKGRGALQDIDQMALIKPHVKWAAGIRQVREIVPALEKAFAIARSGVPGPVFLELPVDTLYPEDNVRQMYGGKKYQGKVNWAMALQNSYISWHVDRVFAGIPEQPVYRQLPIILPKPSVRQVQQACAYLRQAQKPLLVIGSQTMLLADQAERLRQALDSLGIPFYLAGMARGLAGVDSFCQMRQSRKEALREADCVVLLGLPCDFRLDYGRHIAVTTRLISVNRSRQDLMKNRRPHLAIHGDPGTFLLMAAGMIGNTEANGPSPTAAVPPANEAWQNWTQQLRRRDQAREEEIGKQAQATTAYINPLKLCQELEKILPDNAILIADGGDFVATASYILRPRNPLSWLDPGPFGTLGIGAGFALGAKLCRPESEVWVIYGDGSVGYSLIEFDTFARHQIPIIALVGNDACWSQIARDQVEMLHDEVGTRLEYAAYHQAVMGLGCAGLEIKSSAEIVPALQQARQLAAGQKVVLLNAWIGKTEFRKGSLSL